MTKYEELVNFAIEQTAKELGYKGDCEDAARAVVSSFLE
jgi:hypothetical protein